MSDTIIFDTHACVKRMTKAGVEPHVAEAFAAEQVNILEHHIATKTDIANIQRDIEGLRKDTTIELAKLETTLTKTITDSQLKIIVSVGAIASILVAVSKFL